MATETYKVIAQNNPTASVLTDAYTCGAISATISATISSITVCNTGSVQATFRIAVAIAGADDTKAQYILYDVTVNPKDTYVATIGMTLSSTDKIRIYASTSDLAFNFFGLELS